MIFRRKSKIPTHYPLSLTAEEIIKLREVMMCAPQEWHHDPVFREAYYKVEQESRQAKIDKRS